MKITNTSYNVKFTSVTPLIGKFGEIEALKNELTKTVGQEIPYHIENITKQFTPNFCIQSNMYTNAVKDGNEIAALVTGEKATKYKPGISGNLALQIDNRPIELSDLSGAAKKVVELIKTKTPKKPLDYFF